MGILGIENRSENWKTAQHFAPLREGAYDMARVNLVQRLGRIFRPPSDKVRLELYWRGMRDYLHCKPRSRGQCEGDLARLYARLFPDLRRRIESFEGVSRFARLKDGNYEASSPEHRRALHSNLRNTEIDMVLEAPGHLFIGEAKHESILRGSGRNVLVHQLLRQYVMARILVELIAEDEHADTLVKVVPFIVADEGKLDTVRKRAQVDFMIREGWLDEENILSWEKIVTA